ncbi:Extracellular Matrix protein PelC [hydrothermal vent metagenome]|uniref:Extracellular Matrix protein PelC n=1 Tax=hydrothermal vent metagenome TaxID=652676 RepID=A0A1W1B9Q5_9ZZZZ
MSKKLLLLLTFFLILFSGCSSIINKKNLKLPTGKQYAISSFWNYTETPMAGLRASSIVESVLAKEKIILNSLIEGSSEMGEVESRQKFISSKKVEAKALGAEYLITGDVQEWRYKTGIDGEPVVSYSIKIIDLKNDTVIYSSVGAKSGWGHKSIGVVAQEIAEELIPEFIP